jgi:hypothetical protein
MVVAKTSTRSPGRKRVKVSVTVAPDLLAEVDRYVAAHPDVDRSKVSDEALWLWYAREQQRQMEEQFAEPNPPEFEEEYEAWRRIRRAAAERWLSCEPPCTD